MRSRLLVVTLLASVFGFELAQADLFKDFDSLGGNDVLFEKAEALRPETKMTVVQERVVQRRKRFEFAPEYANILGGDPYNKTQNIGLNVHFHFTPQWSLGAKYNHSFNQLRPEGESLINDRELSPDRIIIPEIDYPKRQALVLLNWYPIYGKMNLYDLGVSHFDVYGIVGAGQIELKSGRTNTYTGGMGIGFWVTQHLSARTELRYQSYKVQRHNGEAEMKTTVLGLQVGYLL